MILIADSGSTKTDWRWIGADGSQRAFATEGYNPYFTTQEKMEHSLQEHLMRQMTSLAVWEIFFYGAGCSHPEKNRMVEAALLACFPGASVAVNHDLLGACRALLKQEAGFAAILGTGTNTAMYNGQTISLNIDSLGYLLGDEGSGCYIGKKIIAEYMRRQLPPELEAAFREYCPMSFDELFDRIHFQPLPNRFCAGFARLVIRHRDHPVCEAMIRSAFQDFFEKIVCRYPAYRKYAFHCVGSIAWFNQPMLQEACRKYEMPFGQIIQSPIESLVNFHTR